MGSCPGRSADGRGGGLRVVTTRRRCRCSGCNRTADAGGLRMPEDCGCRRTACVSEPPGHGGGGAPQVPEFWLRLRYHKWNRDSTCERVQGLLLVEQPDRLLSEPPTRRPVGGSAELPGQSGSPSPSSLVTSATASVRASADSSAPPSRSRHSSGMRHKRMPAPATQATPPDHTATWGPP